MAVGVSPMAAASSSVAAGSSATAAGASPMTVGAFRMAPSLVQVLGGDVARVGTENRAKLGAVRLALAGFARDGSVLQIVGASVPSGVPEQPIGWDEIAAGARHRARSAFELGGAALAFGIEDGLVRLASDPTVASAAPAIAAGPLQGIFNVGCAWVTDGARESYGFSSAFAYPPGCVEAAYVQQKPIGDLFDDLWRQNRDAESGRASDLAAAAAAPPDSQGPAEPEPSGRRGGNIGMLTQGRLDRTAYGAQAVTCALMAFLHTDLYD